MVAPLIHYQVDHNPFSPACRPADEEVRLKMSFNKSNVSISPKMNLKSFSEEVAQRRSDASSRGVFPPELWEMILKNLESSHDLLNVSRSSPELLTLLQARKTTWLFDLVLPILLLNAPIEKKDLLKLRVVCQRWRKSVDDHLAIHPRLRPYSKDDFRNMTITATRPHTHAFRGAICKRLNSFTKYLTTDRNPSTNPFVGRTISLQANWGIDKQEYYDMAEQLFEKMGHHVWHFEANYDHADRRPLLFYSSIQRLIKHLPNLRSLTLHGAHYWSIGEDRGNMMQAFVRCVEEKPLPPLSHLASIKLALDAMPGYFYDPFIMVYGNQLQKVIINKWKLKYGPQLTSLVDLDISSLERSEYGSKEIIQNLGAPEKLRSFLPSLHARGSIDAMPEYLKMLERCKNIESLQLHMWSSYWREEMICMDLHVPILPKLKYLSLFHHEKFFYDFLKSLPSLEHLCLHRVSYEDNRFAGVMSGLAVEIRRHFNFSETPKETELWDFLPSLKVFIVINSTLAFENNKVRRYTRKV